MAAPQNAMSGWPKHMYIDGDEKGAIRCQAKGHRNACRHTFTTDESMQRRVEHYTQCARFHNGAILLLGRDTELDTQTTRDDKWKNDHCLLKFMHTLKMCLVCRRVLPESRELFKHIKDDHPEEMDISEIAGFLVYVRKFAHHFPTEETPDLPDRHLVFAEVLQHLLLHIRGYGDWYDTRTLILGHWFNPLLSYEFQQEFFTKPDPHTQFFPYHPDDFLVEGAHHVQIDVKPENRVRTGGIIAALKELYRTGQI